MSDPQAVLNRIVALRQQLEGSQAGASSTPAPNRPSNRMERLELEVRAGNAQAIHLDGTLRQMNPSIAAAENAVLPRQLTARARRILDRGKKLLEELRRLSGFVERETQSDHEPLAQRYRETLAMTETMLRMVQALPDTPSMQLRLCEGIEGIVSLVAERIAQLDRFVAQRLHQREQVSIVANFMRDLAAGEPGNWPRLVGLAEGLLEEARRGMPLRFPDTCPADPILFAASHGLATARVMARVVLHDPEYRKSLQAPVLAALLHDAGMAAAPAEILAQSGSLNDDQRRSIEAHTRTGAAWLQALQPDYGWLAEAAAGHHERQNGTGYPGGLVEAQLAPLTRLVAICDTYAALCSPRPQRQACDTRRAMADTLLLADQGQLDRNQAQHLLCLSFFPVGTVVELSDGSVGIVIATHQGRRDVQAPGRPVVALLADGESRLFPEPAYLDLALAEQSSILRSLPADEQPAAVRMRYLDLVG